MLVIDKGKGLDAEPGHHIPLKFFTNAEIKQVVAIQADGDELEKIRTTCKGIRDSIPTRRLMRWYGDEARFILGNI